jgi:hypothetical protein
MTGDRTGLSISVLNSDHTVYETRTLAMPMAPCDVAAENVAVVIATMLAEFRPAWAASFAPPPVPVRPAALRSLAFEWGPIWASQHTPVASRLALDGAIARRDSPWSLSAGAFFETRQSFNVDGGQAQVQRGGAVLGVGWERWRGSWGQAVRLQAGAALLAVSGHGFLDDHTSVSLNPVVGADASLRVAWSRLGGAVGPAAECWPRTQGLMVGTTSSNQSLPAFVFSLRISVGYYSHD